MKKMDKYHVSISTFKLSKEVEYRTLGLIRSPLHLERDQLTSKGGI
ncbi:hypothetical protein Lser_V15G03149 [Lactuca serriola]